MGSKRFRCSPRLVSWWLEYLQIWRRLLWYWVLSSRYSTPLPRRGLGLLHFTVLLGIVGVNVYKSKAIFTEEFQQISCSVVFDEGFNNHPKRPLPPAVRVSAKSWHRASTCPLIIHLNYSIPVLTYLSLNLKGQVTYSRLHIIQISLQCPTVSASSDVSKSQNN